jgi:ribonuclease BN (tRNA processing enzyme)
MKRSGENMRVTVLGCQSPYPGPGGATPGYLIQTDQVSLLLDCGSGVVSQLGKYLPPYALDALILSHYHHDHIADVGVLQYGIMVHQLTGERDKNRMLPIYAPAQPTERAQQVSYRQATMFHPVDESTRLTIGDAELTFLQTDHGNGDPCYAVKLKAGGKTLVYSADSGPATVWNGFAEQADLFICEGTFLRRNRPEPPIGHLSVQEAAEIAQALQCRALMITHLFPAYTTEEVLAEAAAFTHGRCFVAEIGLQIEL